MTIVQANSVVQMKCVGIHADPISSTGIGAIDCEDLLYQIVDEDWSVGTLGEITLGTSSGLRILGEASTDIRVDFFSEGNLTVSFGTVGYAPYQQASTSLPATDDTFLLRRIRHLVTRGQVGEARRILKLSFPGSSADVDYWKRVLAVPQAKVERSATGGESKSDYAWLRTNSGKYIGKWVALKDGLLLGSHEKRNELHRRLKQQNKLTGAMFVRITDA